MAVSFAKALGTTAFTGDRAISVAVALETIACDGNDENNRDDGDNEEGGGISVA